MTPQRIQRPWIWPHPRTAINCARPTKFGNPYRTGNPSADVESYREWLHNPDAQPIRVAKRLYRPLTEADRQELHGQDIACFCPVGNPCHGEVLLEWANR
jgi:hypothetical protein